MRFRSDIQIEGTIAGLYLGIPERAESRSVECVEATLEGFQGDRHYGFEKRAGVREKMYQKGTPIRNNRQWSAVSIAELNAIAANMGVSEVRPEWVGANILFDGIPNVTNIPPLSRLVISRDGERSASLIVSEDSTSLVVYDDNLPCTYAGDVVGEQYQNPKLAAHFVKAAMGKRGCVGWVEKRGQVHVGDAVRVYIPDFYPDAFIEAYLRQ